jgi:DNA-binding GntR family transcriptional regulator
MTVGKLKSHLLVERRRTIPRKKKLQSAEAYERIREMILTAELPPGRHITEVELAHQLGMGRMPVREALQRLAQEDLITIVPRKGSMVAPIQIDDLQKIFELRLVLEGLSAQLAAERITDEELDSIENLIDMVYDVDEGSREHVRIDREFHLRIALATRNEYLHRAVERVLNHALRLLYISGSRMARVKDIRHEYDAVIRALRRREGRAAALAMQSHIEEFRKKVRSSI